MTEIFIIGDEKSAEVSLEDRLMSAGHNVCGKTGSMAEALQMIEETQPDLVITALESQCADDGINTARWVKENFSGPVISLTDMTDRHVTEEADGTKPADCFLMPFQSEKLISTIERVLCKADIEKNKRECEILQRTLAQASAVCHDLNQPLMAISGFSSVISMNLSNEDPLYETIQKMSEQVEKMGKITRELMQITRREPEDSLMHRIGVGGVDKASHAENSPSF